MIFLHHAKQFCFLPAQPQQHVAITFSQVWASGKLPRGIFLDISLLILSCKTFKIWNRRTFALKLVYSISIPTFARHQSWFKKLHFRGSTSNNWSASSVDSRTPIIYYLLCILMIFHNVSSTVMLRCMQIIQLSTALKAVLQKYSIKLMLIFKTWFFGSTKTN